MNELKNLEREWRKSDASIQQEFEAGEVLAEKPLRGDGPTEQMTFQELEKKVQEWFLIEDRGVLKALMASVIANRLEGDPVWLFLIAPSGGLKTELIQGLNDIPEVYQVSTLTPQTLLSGQGQKESLLFKLTEQKKSILTFKDFTTILQLYHVARNEIMAQLREIYDGSYRKEVGMKGVNNLHWTGKLGFVSGVTGVVDITQGIYSSLGERFLQYRIKQPPRKEVMKRVLKNSGKMGSIRKELRENIRFFIESIEIPTQPPTLSEEVVESISELADFITLTRSPVIREGYQRTIEFKPDSEMPTRFIAQINLIGVALKIINRGELTDEDKQILRKLAFDSIPQQRRMMLEFLARNEVKENSKIAARLNYPATTTRRILEDLNILGLVSREKPDTEDDNSSEGDGRADKWTLKENYKELILKSSEGLKLEDDELDKTFSDFIDPVEE